MQKISTRISLLLVATVVLSMSMLTSLASAQDSSRVGGNGIRISPVRTDLTINPGESSTVTLSVQNTTQVEAEFQAIINDFTVDGNEFGQPALILDEDEFAPSHSLKRYIAEIPNVTIPAEQSKQVVVSISMPADVSAGGYFGAVRFAPVRTDGSGNVSLTASVGSLILVKVPGDISENMVLNSFDVRTSEESNNASSVFMSNNDLFAVARFENLGNVHEQPFGKIVLKRGNEVLQTVEINNSEPKANVLPDSIRRFSVKLDEVGVWGKYTVTGNFGYGTTGQLISGSSTFYVIPLIPILIGLGAIALIAAAIFLLPKAIKRYNQNVIRQANRRK